MTKILMDSNFELCKQLNHSDTSYENTITGSALTFPPLFTENTDKNQCLSYSRVHLTSPPKWGPMINKIVPAQK